MPILRVFLKPALLVAAVFLLASFSTTGNPGKPAQADLQVSEFAATGFGSPGQQINFSFLAWNRGSSASGEYAAALVIASTEAWEYGTVISTGIMQSLAPGANQFVQGDAKVPELEPGYYYLIIVIDPEEQIVDADRSNNVAVQGFEVQ